MKVDKAATHAADITGRARAFKSLVDAGMKVDKAATVTGLE